MRFLLRIADPSLVRRIAPLSGLKNRDRARRIFQPETLVRWHRADFCRYWRLEVVATARAAAHRDRIARADPAEGHRETHFGASRASMTCYAISVFAIAYRQYLKRNG